MTLQKDRQKRQARVGKGILPPNPKQWENEHNGLDLRDALGLSSAVVLAYEDAFDLIQDAIVLPHGEVNMAQKHVDHLRGAGKKSWSGLAISLPDRTLVVYNDSHPPCRVRATLMEEFFHLWLGHPASKVRLYRDGTANRDYNRRIESEAYGSGAAALLPYAALRQALKGGISVQKIATNFHVSEDLVLFRAKVTKLYKLVKR